MGRGSDRRARSRRGPPTPAPAVAAHHEELGHVEDAGVAGEAAGLRDQREAGELVVDGGHQGTRDAGGILVQYASKCGQCGSGRRRRRRADGAHSSRRCRAASGCRAPTRSALVAGLRAIIRSGVEAMPRPLARTPPVAGPPVHTEGRVGKEPARSCRPRSSCATRKSACAYLPGRRARQPLRAPVRPLTGAEFDARLAAGDRRAGHAALQPGVPGLRRLRADPRRRPRVRAFALAAARARQGGGGRHGAARTDRGGRGAPRALSRARARPRARSRRTAADRPDRATRAPSR